MSDIPFVTPDGKPWKGIAGDLRLINVIVKDHRVVKLIAVLRK